MSNSIKSLSPAAKRRIAVLFFTFATLAVCDVFIRKNDSALDEFYVNHYRRKLDALHARPEPPRILLLGSSRVAYALVPQEFEQVIGAPAFNFGIPASKVLEWQILFSRYVEAMKPGLIVLGVNASEIRADYEPVSAARDLFDWDDLFACLREDGWSSTVVGHFLERNSGIAWALLHRRYETMKWLQERAESVFPKYAQIARERRLRVITPCSLDGYEHPWAANRRMKSLEAQLEIDSNAVMVASMPQFDPQAPAVRRFGELLAHCRDTGIPLVVAYIPNSPRAEKRWMSVESDLEKTIARCCHEAGINYIGAPMTEVPRTDADYLDETHVGLALAKRLSRRIAERSMRLGLLTGNARLAKGATGSEGDAP
ncbi:MAG: hypothetical protein IPK83_06525 [Planctomycetes bacterium]|nr:hypothetical protein [Planctomycetota bacterium]